MTTERTALEMLRVIVGNAKPANPARCIAAVLGSDHCIKQCLDPRDCSATPLTKALYTVLTTDIEAARSIIATAEARENDWRDFPPGGPSHEGDDTREDEFQFPPRKCSRTECNGTTAPQAALRCSRWLDGGCELMRET